VITLGITKTVSPNQPLENVLADIHAQHGLAIAAHPVQHFWAELLPMREKFDGAEVMHPIAYSAARADWRWPDMLKFYDESAVPLTAIGSSDYHWGSVLGLCRTLIFVKEPVTESSILDAIREKHTATIDLQGTPMAPPSSSRRCASSRTSRGRPITSTAARAQPTASSAQSAFWGSWARCSSARVGVRGSASLALCAQRE